MKSEKDALEEEAKAAAFQLVCERLKAASGGHQVGESLIDEYMVGRLLAEANQTKRALEANLRSLTHNQLSSALKTDRLLHQARLKIPDLQTQFDAINGLAKDSDEMMRDFPYELNQLRENLFETREMVDNLVHVEDRVTRAHELLADEEQLLEAHAEVASLVQMRTEYEEAAKETGDIYVIEGVDKYMFHVGNLEKDFDELLQQHMEATFELARKKPSLLKQVLKVIELEEKADRKREPENVKSYHFTFREKLSESLENRFNAVFADAAQSDITEALQIVEQVYDNLPIVQQVSKYFPSKYMIYEFYVGNIHRNLRTCLGQIAQQQNLKSGEIVNLYYWSNVKYVAKLEELNLKASEWPITDVLEPAIPTYSKHLRKLMNKWSVTLLARDRNNPSYIQISNCLMTDSIVSLFSFLNQQIDLASKSTDSFFIYRVSAETKKVVEDFQEAEMLMLSNDWKELHPKYIIAVLNNNAKAYDYTEEYEFKVRSLLKESELGKFDKLEEQLEDGFEKVRKLAVISLVNQFFSLFEENGVFDKLFSKDWYGEGEGFTPIEVVTHTLSDMMDQTVKRHLHSKYVGDVGKEFLDRLLKRYIEELTKVKIPFKPETAERIELDRGWMESTFSRYLSSRSYLARRMKLLSTFKALIDSSMDDQGNFILSYNSLLDDYPDLTPDIFERVIEGRQDCESDVLQDIVQACQGILPSQNSFKPFFSEVTIRPMQLQAKGRKGLQKLASKLTTSPTTNDD